MSEYDSIVIVGAGQAGGRAAEGLRRNGFAGRVTIVGEEAHPPYERPPLSKQVLTGERPSESTHLHERSYYDENDIALRLGSRVESIDRPARRLRLGNGETVAYDRAIIATGARPRRLFVPGVELGGVHVLRGIEDCAAIRAGLDRGASVAVVGGGYIGLEVAAAAAKRGCGVTVIEALERCLARVVAPEVGRYCEELHRGHGVDIRTGAVVTRFEGRAGRIRRVLCADGDAIDADLVVVGIGITPNIDLAEAAGLAVDDGIVVDAFGCTSDPAIYAAGDVTRHPNPLLGRTIRLESWQNAQNQAAAVARALCGQPAPYSEVPWFWTDQYDMNLQAVGLAERWDRVVVRGDMGSHSFSAFYLEGGRLAAANAVNNARDIPIARRLIAAGAAVDGDALADPSVSLRDRLKGATSGR